LDPNCIKYYINVYKIKHLPSLAGWEAGVLLDCGHLRDLERVRVALRHAADEDLLGDPAEPLHQRGAVAALGETDDLVLVIALRVAEPLGEENLDLGIDGDLALVLLRGAQDDGREEVGESRPGRHGRRDVDDAVVDAGHERRMEDLAIELVDRRALHHDDGEGRREVAEAGVREADAERLLHRGRERRLIVPVAQRIVVRLVREVVAELGGVREVA